MPGWLLSLLTGMAVGFLFRAVNLPIPAPSTLTGVLGIVGIFAGYWLAARLFGQR